jgi:hypothetical protein
MLVFNIDFRQDNIKTETLKFQPSENQKFEQNLTSMHISDVNMSENVKSTNMLQSQLVSSTDVQIERGGYERVSMKLPEDVTGEFKTYMDYRCISDEGSNQFKLQQQAYTDSQGFRKVDDKYIVALGTYFTQSIGDEFHITLDSGVEFDAIVGDIKRNNDTDSTNKYIEKNHNIVEYIVDTDVLNETALVMGDVSYAGFEGKIIKIERMIK